MQVHRPARYMRLVCRGNFGGPLGIALRKISFYGYEVRPVEASSSFSVIITGAAMGTGVGLNLG